MIHSSYLDSPVLVIASILLVRLAAEQRVSASLSP